MITIIKTRMIIKVYGAEEALISHLLQYTHRLSTRVPIEGDKFGRTFEKTVYEERKLYAVLPDGAIMFQHGLLPKVTAFLTKMKIPFTVEDQFPGTSVPDYDNLFKVFKGLQFRNKQDIILATVAASSCGQIVAPAGLGKTESICMICALYPKATIVVAAPGQDLVKDTFKRLNNKFPGEVGMVGAGSNEMGRITICTYQSLKKIPPSKIDMCLVDEVHRSACSMLATPLAAFVNAEKIIGFTATPKGRSDGAEMVTEAAVGPVLMTIDYEDAMKNGSVSSMQVLMVDIPSGPDETLFTEQIAKKRNLYWKNIYRNKEIARTIQAYTQDPSPLGLQDPQVLILVDTSVHAAQLAKFLPDYTLVYKSTGKTGLPKLKQKQIDQIFKDFQSRKLKKVIATCCWGTGVDFPDLDILVMASGKTSPIEVVQNTGRCTRVGSGEKKKGYVVDFKDSWSTWAAGRAKSRVAQYKKMGWEIFG